MLRAGSGARPSAPAPRSPEVLPEVHPRRPGGACAGEHQHPHIVAELEVIEDAQHLAVERRAHGVALLRAIELHPGNGLPDLNGHGIGFGSFAHESLSPKNALDTTAILYSSMAPDKFRCQAARA